MKIIFIAAFIVAASTAIASAASSLCLPRERVLFSCELTQSKKIVSLCTSPNVSASTGYIQYRFGTNKSVELAYPDGKLSPKGRFELFRTQFIRSAAYGISFKRDGFEYALSYMASGPDPNDDSYPLTVTAKSAETPVFSDVCDKSTITGKTAFYPLEKLSKELGIKMVETEDDQ